MPALPSLHGWRTRTKAKVGARGKTNPEILTIDHLLAGYSLLGKWHQSVEPAIKIINTVAQWETRRRHQESTRRPAMRLLWSEARAVIVKMAALVCQSEFHTLRGEGEPRFLYTGGATCCVVVVLYSEAGQKATLGHIQQANDAAESVRKMTDALGAAKDARAWLAGGRAKYQGQKVEALIQALLEAGVKKSSIDSSRTLLADEAPTLNVAFDRQTGELVDDASEIKMLDWKIRSMYPQVGKKPPLVEYMEPTGVRDDVGYLEEWKRKAVSI